MKKISTFLALTILAGVISLNLFLKKDYELSALLTVTCIVCISLFINSFELLNMDKKRA